MDIQMNTWFMAIASIKGKLFFFGSVEDSIAEGCNRCSFRFTIQMISRVIIPSQYVRQSDVYNGYN